MTMNRLIPVILAVLLLFAAPACAQEEGEAGLSHIQYEVYEAVRRNVDFPKNAQVKRAAEYFCKVEGQQMRLLLIEASQSETIETRYGKGAGALVVDLQTGEYVTYANADWQDTFEISSPQEALNLIYCCYVSYLEGMNEWVFADHELYFPLGEEEIAAVNAGLNAFFLR